MMSEEEKKIRNEVANQILQRNIFTPQKPQVGMRRVKAFSNKNKTTLVQ